MGNIVSHIEDNYELYKFHCNNKGINTLDINNIKWLDHLKSFRDEINSSE